MIAYVQTLLFGAGASGPLPWLVALTFIVYPFVCLPLVFYSWSRFDGRRLKRLEADRARDGAPASTSAASTEGPAEQPFERYEHRAVAPARERFGRRASADRLVRILEEGTPDQRLEASRLLAELGTVEALDAMERLDRELGEEVGRLAAARREFDDEPRREVRREWTPRRSPEPARAPVDLESAARELVLAEGATPDLRAAALDFLVSQGRSPAAAPRAAMAAGASAGGRRAPARAYPGSLRAPSSHLRRA